MSPEEFVFNTPLYDPVSESVDEILDSLIQHASISVQDYSFEGYNPTYETETTYRVSESLETRNNLRMFHDIYDHFFDHDDVWYVTLKCSRYQNQLYIILFLNASDHSIMKVGQYPSVADMHIGKIKQYKSVLSKEDLKEFTRAIGLAANGVGIGSFVYLRRIFEKLIYESAKEAIKDCSIKEEEFTKLRMDEKISAIQDYVPETLVELKSVYGILSKGIHELAEQECLAYFATMRIGIELILDEKLEKKRRIEKKRLAVSAISEIKSRIK